MTEPMVVLCTGANQGLGFSTLKVSGLRYPSYTYIIGSRDTEKGKEANKKLKAAGVKARLDVLQLDVTNDDQIAAAASYVEKAYGKLDILINNAGIIGSLSKDLPSIRSTYNDILNTNITSVAVITEAFKPLLYKSNNPKVINVSSGLGSIQNSLKKKMGRSPPYGASKIGLNGLTVHLQLAENDRVEAGMKNGVDLLEPRIQYYACAPGPLKTGFTNFSENPICKPPEAGAEVIVRLIADEHEYEGGSFWEFEEGEMRRIPW